MDFRIMPATARDADGVLRLYRAQVGREFCFWDNDYPGPDTIGTDLEKGNLFVMKTAVGEIVAAVSAEEDPDVERLDCWTPSLRPGGEFARLAVSPAFQNRGLARRMVRHILETLKKRGYRSVHILVNRENVTAPTRRSQPLY